MPRFRVLVYLLLSLTSIHVLVADVGVHEHIISHDGDPVLSQSEHGHAAGGATELSPHCCQCHGFVSPLAVAPAPVPMTPVPSYSGVPALPPAPDSQPYRPPIA